MNLKFIREAVVIMGRAKYIPALLNQVSGPTRVLSFPPSTNAGPISWLHPHRNAYQSNVPVHDMEDGKIRLLTLETIFRYQIELSFFNG